MYEVANNHCSLEMSLNCGSLYYKKPDNEHIPWVIFYTKIFKSTLQGDKLLNFKIWFPVCIAWRATFTNME